MKIIAYKIQKEDTLESIAEKHDIPVEEMVGFHNKYGGITQQIIGNKLPMYLQHVVLDGDRKKEIKTGVVNEEGVFKFDQQARYRCEQINTTKINDNLVQFVEQKFQYLYKLNLNLNVAYVEQEDYLKKLSPPVLNDAFEFIEQTEKIRHKVLLKINPENGFISDVLNKEEVRKEWEDFKTQKVHTFKYINDLKDSNIDMYNHLMEMGDMQFFFKSNYKKEYQRDFFYFSCLDQYLFKNDFEKISFDYLSTLLPPIVIPLTIRYDKIEEKNGIITLKKIAEYTLSEEQMTDIQEKYNELHKESIGYNFTDYKLIFRSVIEFDSATKMVSNAKVVFKESILDNIENECHYHIRKLENFTPYENE